MCGKVYYKDEYENKRVNKRRRNSMDGDTSAQGVGRDGSDNSTDNW